MLDAGNCCICGTRIESGERLCASCREDLPAINRACLRCGVPLAVDGAICADCQRGDSVIDVSLIPFAYRFPIDALIRGLKFHGDLAIAVELGALLAAHVADAARPDCLVPVPMHPLRLIERGYNQALELARPIARRLGVPLSLMECRRLRHTAPQTDLTAQARRRNVRRVFGVKAAFAHGHVAIIDDVVTTGSTVEELARTLKRAGVRRVQVWACARAGL